MAKLQKLSKHLSQWAAVYWFVSNMGLIFVIPVTWQGFAAIVNALFILAAIAILDKVSNRKKT